MNHAIAKAPAPEFKLLDEGQNATFDADYHTPEELAEKIARMLKRSDGPPRSILDIGGGNGHFLDQLLETFPEAEGYLLDISPLLLELNKPNPRKTLVHGSIEDLETLITGKNFDVITINWVLHHLVGDTHRGSIDNAVKTLERTARLLSPNGHIVVAENLLDGRVGADIPSRIIFAITSQKNRAFVRTVRPFFNTAGVGVCFHSEVGWKRIFDRAGLAIADEFRGRIWNQSIKRKLLYPFLVLRSERHGHFWLGPKKAEATV